MWPELFFAGTTNSSGVLANRSGAPTRRLHVEGSGLALPDGSFRLDQSVTFDHDAPHWSGWFGGLEALLQTANFAVSVMVVTFMFAMIYKFIPRVAIRWSDVWIGALVTSLLFALGKVLIGIYIGKTGVESSYGAAGALAVILVWVYYSAQIFLLGAEFTKGYAESHGSRKNMKPDVTSTAEASPRT